MEATSSSVRQAPLTRALPRIDFAAAATWLLPIILIAYLGLNNGGYDIVERSEVGIAVWWVVLLGTLVAALTPAGGTRAGRATLLVLAGFAAWTALSLGWTESAERTSIELGRTATYLGVFALALAVQGEGRWRHLLNGVTVGVAGIAAIAVLSRLEPSWFPEQSAGDFLPGIEIESRLAYPLNYSTALGALAAISLPLLLAATGSARTIAVQALAAAALPVAALALWLTGSGMAVPAVAVSLGTFLLLAPDRLPKIASLLNAGVGAAILMAAVDQREALDRGLPTPAAQAQGDEMLAVVLVVCVGVALIQVGLSLATRYAARPDWLSVDRRTAIAATAITGAVVGTIALAAGAGGALSGEWEEFTGRGETPPGQSSRGDELLDFSSSGRYELWEAAIDAGESEPLLGIGPGTYEFWWARNGDFPGFVRDAHSLFLESYAELGLVGFLLIAAFSVAVLAIGVVRSRRAPPELRLGLAAATAACAAFVFTAAMDWMWELAVLPAVFLTLSAILIAGGHGRPSRAAVRSVPWRAAIGVLAVGAIVAITLPFAAASSLDDSREDADTGSLDSALAAARNAASVQPYAASPRLQEALLLEQQGELDRAAGVAHEATERESTNWRNWLTLARLEARSGDAEAAVAAYRTATSLTDIRALPDATVPEEAARDQGGARPAPELTKLQEALILARRGNLDRAVVAARQATVEEPKNRRAWLVLAAIESELGDTAAAAEAFRQGQALREVAPSP